MWSIPVKAIGKVAHTSQSSAKFDAVMLESQDSENLGISVKHEERKTQIAQNLRGCCIYIPLLFLLEQKAYFFPE